MRAVCKRSNRGALIHRAALSVAGAVLAGAPGLAGAQSYTITDLGTLGGTQSYAWGINDLGQVVGWARTAGGQRHAYRWTSGVMTDLLTLGTGSESFAYDINNSGVVVGRSFISGGSGNRAFRWDGSMTDLSTLGVGTTSEAWAINGSGQITGRMISGGEDRAFVVTGSTTTVLPGTFVQNGHSYGYGINDAAHIVGYATTNPLDNEFRGFRWPGSGDIVDDLGTLGGTNSFAYDINTAGVIVGGAYLLGDTEQAFIWNGSMTALGSLGGFEAEAWGINDSGTIVGYSNLVGDGAPYHAFVSNGAGMTDLNTLIPADSGWVLNEARDINSVGQIVGGGTIGGETHGFLLTPIPQWANAAGGDWATDGNWNPSIAPTASQTAIFNLSSVAGYTVTFAGATQIGAVSVRNDKPTFNLGGSTLTVSGAVAIAPGAAQNGQLSLSNGTVSAVTVDVGGSSSGAGGTALLNINAGATLAISGAVKIWNTTGTQVTLNGGTITAGAIDADSNSAHFIGDGVTTGWISGVVEITNSNPVIGSVGPFGASLSLGTGKTLRIKDASQFLKVESGSSIGFSGGKLDLTDKKLIAVSGDIGSWNGSAYTGITGDVASGRNGGVWDGPGITTSMTHATSGSGYTMLGVATGSEVRGIGPTDTDTWAGQTVTGSDTLVMYTYGGDANLSGNVDVDDYGQMDFNAAIGGVLTGWFNGDFDYNGFQDVDDYGIIDFVINIQGTPFLTAGSGNVVSVPEPASVATLVLGSSVLLGRRRRS